MQMAEGEQRVDVASMKQQPSLCTETAFKTAIALMGFDSQSSFDEYVNRVRDHNEVDPRVLLAHAWRCYNDPAIKSDDLLVKHNHPIHGPLYTERDDILLRDEDELKTATLITAQDATKRWMQPLQWYPWGIETTQEWNVALGIHNKIESCIRIVMPEDQCTVQIKATNVALIGGGFASGVVPLALDYEHYVAFRNFVEDAQKILPIGTFATVLKSLVVGMPETVTERQLAFAGALELEAYKHEDVTRGPALPAIELPPWPMSPRTLKIWQQNRSPEVSRRAVTRLGCLLPRPDDSESAALDLLMTLNDTRLEPEQEASEAFVNKLVGILRDLCCDLSMCSYDVPAVHYALDREIHGDDMQEHPTNAHFSAVIRDFETYQQNLHAMVRQETPQWVALTTFLVRSLQDEAQPHQREQLRQRVLETALRRLVTSAIIPNALKSGITEFRTCNDRYTTEANVRLIMSHSERPDGVDARSIEQMAVGDFTDKHVKLFFKTKIQQSLEARLGQNAQTQSEISRLHKLIDEIRLVGDSIDAVCDVVRQGLEVLDKANPVRVMLTFRTGGFVGKLNQTAFAMARDMIDQKDTITHEGWSKRLHHLMTYGQGSNQRTQPIGPFYMISLNGASIADAVTSDVRALFNDLVHTPTPKGTHRPHLIYSAYGLSGSGKTRTLLLGEHSVVRALLGAFSNLTRDNVFDMESKDGSRQKARAEIAISDVYGEKVPENATDTICSSNVIDPNAITRRRHLVSYTDAAFDSARRGLELSAARDRDYQKQPLDLSETHFTGLRPKFSKEMPLLELPALIRDLSKCKKSHNFAEKGEPPIYHIRSTPNNPESSRAHTCISIRIVSVGQPEELARITLIDMAGAEDTTAIEKAYFQDIAYTLYNLEKMPFHDKALSASEFLKQLNSSINGMLETIDAANTLLPPADVLRNASTGQKLETAAQIKAKLEAALTPIANEEEEHTIRLAQWASLFDESPQNARADILRVLHCPPATGSIIQLKQCWLTLRKTQDLMLQMVESRFPGSNLSIDIGNIAERVFKTSHWIEKKVVKKDKYSVDSTIDVPWVPVTQDKTSNLMPAVKLMLDVFAQDSKQRKHAYGEHVRTAFVNTLASDQPCDIHVSMAFDLLYRLWHKDVDPIVQYVEAKSCLYISSTEWPVMHGELAQGLERSVVEAYVAAKTRLIRKNGTVYVCDSTSVVNMLIHALQIHLVLQHRLDWQHEWKTFRKKQTPIHQAKNIDGWHLTRRFFGYRFLPNKVIDLDKGFFMPLVNIHDERVKKKFDDLLGVPPEEIVKTPCRYFSIPEECINAKSTVASTSFKTTIRECVLPGGRLHAAIEQVTRELSRRMADLRQDLGSCGEDIIVSLEQSGWLDEVRDEGHYFDYDDVPNSDWLDGELESVAKLHEEAQVRQQEADAGKQHVHCPLRYQGEFIMESIRDIQCFVKNLAHGQTHYDKLQQCAGRDPVQSWIDYALLRSENESERESSHIKFTQIVAMRTDFSQVPDAKEDEVVKSRRDGLRESVEFACGLNPLNADTTGTVCKQFDVFPSSPPSTN